MIVGGESNLAVDLRSLAWRSPGPVTIVQIKPLDKDFEVRSCKACGAPVHRVVRSRRDALGAFTDDGRRDLIVEIVRARSFLARVVEHSDPVEIRFVDERLDLRGIAVRLGWESEDECGADAGQGIVASNTTDDLVESLAPTPSTHPFEHTRRYVLQRQIEVGHHDVRSKDGVDQLIGYTLRVEVHQTDPAHALDALKVPKQQREITLIRVASPHDRILAHERQLRDARRCKVAGLADDGLD